MNIYVDEEKIKQVIEDTVKDIFDIYDEPKTVNRPIKYKDAKGQVSTLTINW